MIEKYWRLEQLQAVLKLLPFHRVLLYLVPYFSKFTL